MDKRLDEIRRDIDQIDRQMIECLKARMDAAGRVAAYKQERGLPVLDSGREQALLQKVEEQAGEEFADYFRFIYEAILKASRSYQHEKMKGRCTRRSCESSKERAEPDTEKKRCGLVGEKLEHSFSPEIHKKLGDYSYSLFELKPEELENFLCGESFDALNVTIPYKKAVMPYCSTLTEQAKRIGSVNTIVRQPDGSLLGHNTDYDGFCYLLRSAGAAVEGKKALVLGTGGASLTVCTALQDLGAREIVSISRSGPNHYNNLELHSDAQLIVNTTPVGMYPNNGGSLLNLDLFPKLEGVFDLVYNPSKTQLLLDAEQRGICRANGLGMLVAQAKAASELFTGVSIPDSRVDEITREMERSTRNIMLVGMPGCGKTTIGRLLSLALGRPLVDTDAMVEEMAGCTIPKIFATQGEEAFRRLEHRALCLASKESGTIIATGGGIVTRPENFDPMRQNSTVVFIRRPVEQLPTAGRPISQSGDLKDLYSRRLPLYQKAADWTVDNVTVQSTVEEIIRRLEA